MTNSTVLTAPEDGVAWTAVRVLPNGEPRRYTISSAPSGHHAVAWTLRTASKIGFVRDPATMNDPTDCYAVMDVLNADDDIVASYAIPHAHAWRWWYRTLHLRVAEVDE